MSETTMAPTDSAVIPHTLGLHHVGIVVGDLATAAARYELLGFHHTDPVHVPDQGVTVVAYAAPPGYVELLQPTDPTGAIGRFHAKRGDGLHHVAYQVTDLEATLARLRANGLRLIDERPRLGLHGWRVAFIHPESCAGVLTELVQI